MLLVGTRRAKPKIPVIIDFDGLLHHTLVVGQSGSGKSFFVARLIEEILLRTRARVLIIDPNGDFRRISTPSDLIWTNQTTRFTDLADLCKTNGMQNFDERDAFKLAWAKRRYIYLNPSHVAETVSDTGTEHSKDLYHRLVIHWDSLTAELQRFLLNANPTLEPKVLLGLETVAESAEKLAEDRAKDGYGFDLRGLLNMAEQYALRNEGLADYEKAKALTPDDWFAVHAKISDVLARYNIWWSRKKNASTRPVGLAEFIDGPFEGDRRAETYWDALILSLDASSPSDTLLTVEVALARLWQRAKDAWRRRAEPNVATGADKDERVPTFVVIDEAHNFAPERSSDPLRDKVTDRLMQIASEGRKYGLYLILATQRPTKLHRELVPECENSCLLRLQSDVECKFACDVLGYADKNINAVQTFVQGQGLFNGRWVESQGQTEAMIAPARIVVGGGGLSSDWKNIPEETPPVSGLTSKISEFVQMTLKASSAPIPLVSLAGMLEDEFDQLRSGDWAGHGTLKQLLMESNIESLNFAGDPPAFAYLEGKHSPPKPTTFAPDQIPDEIRRSVDLMQSYPGFPALSKDTFRIILISLSNEVQKSPYDYSDVSKAVRDDCRRQNVTVGRNAINFIMRGISFGGHRFDPDLPQSPPILAEAFCRSVIKGLQKRGVRLEADTVKALRGYLSGGILQEEASEVIG